MISKPVVRVSWYTLQQKYVKNLAEEFFFIGSSSRQACLPYATIKLILIYTIFEVLLGRKSILHVHRVLLCAKNLLKLQTQPLMLVTIPDVSHNL